MSDRRTSMALARAMTLLPVVTLLLTSLPQQHNVRAAVILTSSNHGTGSDATNQQSATAPPSGGNNRTNGNVEVIFASPEAQGDGDDEGGSNDDGLNLAHMRVRVDDMTKDDWMAFICDRVPSTVVDCRGIPDLKTYLETHRDRLLGILTSAKKRKRRASTDPFWASPWNLGGNNLGFPSLEFGPWQPIFNPVVPPATPQPGAPVAPGGLQNDPFGQIPVGGSAFRQTVSCPTPVDQTFVYRPVPDATGYPGAAIGEEIANPLNLQLRACLSREVLTALSGPVPVSEPFRDTASPTCPFTQLRLWRYQSLSQGAECWVLQNFGDFVLYRTCTNKFCSNCRDDRSGFFSLSGFGQTPALATNLQKLCIPDYRAVSFWAYCPANSPGLRLVRDRIILPLTCNCQGVRCQPVPDTGFQG